MTQGERITALETEVRHLREDLQKLIARQEELLALKNKGTGAFWLVSLIFGSSMMGAGAAIMNFFKG